MDNFKDSAESEIYNTPNLGFHTEESLVYHELDLTDHHEQILAGINSIKNLYGVSRSEARKCVESGYTEKLDKVPRLLERYQSDLVNLKYYMISIQKSMKLSKYKFLLLKCLSSEGPCSLSIEGFKEDLALISNGKEVETNENQVSEIVCKVLLNQSEETHQFRLFLQDKIAKIPIEQLQLTKTISFFENIKYPNLDLSLFISVEPSRTDIFSIFRLKAQEIQRKVEKTRSESQEINLKSVFKGGCCECLIN